MTDFLLLRLEGPLMSFGGPAVDQNGVTQDFPALSMLTGLLANALGYDHSQGPELNALQARIRYAARADRRGSRLRDYQTVDLGQEHLVDTGWTTRGVRDDRGSGEATSGTHIRYRDYLADALYLVAIELAPGAPSLDDVQRALEGPARPLFLGRKPCLPSVPVLWKRVQARDLLDALRSEPRLERHPAERRHARDGGKAEGLLAWWPDGLGDASASRLMPVTDERDWVNRIHVGRRLIRQGLIQPAEAKHG